jgi:shikimate 5-dehydrogenase
VCSDSAEPLANCTHAPLMPGVTPCPCRPCRTHTHIHTQFKVVFDAVYTPRETRLLRDAQAAGCLVADGVAMFVGQAVEQLKLFTGATGRGVQGWRQGAALACTRPPQAGCSLTSALHPPPQNQQGRTSRQCS